MNYSVDARHDDNSCVYNGLPSVRFFEPDSVFFEQDVPIVFSCSVSDDRGLNGVTVGLYKSGEFVTANSGSVSGLEDEFTFQVLIDPSEPDPNQRPRVEQPEDPYGEYQVEVNVSDDYGQSSQGSLTFHMIDTVVPRVDIESLDLDIVPDQNIVLNLNLYDHGWLSEAVLELWSVNEQGALLRVQEALIVTFERGVRGQYLSRWFTNHDLQNGDFYRVAVTARDRFGNKKEAWTDTGQCSW